MNAFHKSILEGVDGLGLSHLVPFVNAEDLYLGAGASDAVNMGLCA